MLDLFVNSLHTLAKFYNYTIKLLMSDSLKSILKTLLIGIGGVVVFCLLASIPYIHNSIAKIIIMQSINDNNIQIKNCDVFLTSQKIKIKNTDINLFGTQVIIPEISMEYNLSNLLRKLKTDFQITAPKLTLSSGIELRASAAGTYKYKDHKILISPHFESGKIKIADADISKLSLDSSIEISRDKIALINTILQIGDGSLSSDVDIDLEDSKLKNIQISSDIKLIDLGLYKGFLFKTHPVYEFLESSVLGGRIDSAKLNINIPHEFIKLIEDKNEKEISTKFLDEYIDAKFILSGLIYKYSDYMPMIKSDTLSLNVKGKNIIIDLLGTKVAGNVVTKGTVSFDYLADNLDIAVDANTKGSVSDLIQFINPKAIKKMADSNIDLTKLKGSAESKIIIVIPVGREIPNKYDIKSNITKVSGNLLNDKVNLSNYVLNGNFDGEHVTIIGKGTTNGFTSSINLLVNLNESEEVSHKLLGKINLTPSQEESDAIKFINGSSELNYEFTAKKNVATLKANANLVNLHFTIPSISLDKPAGKKANFNLTGEIKEGKKQRLELKLSGEDGLKIAGIINIDDLISKLTFSEVKYLNNDFKAEIISGNKKLIAKVSGGLIDLSETDFTKFFKDDNSKTDTVKLDIHLDTVAMKNNVTLKNANIVAECNNSKCPVALINADIGDKKVTIEYHNIMPKAYWHIETDSAGKLIASLGLTAKLKKGTLKADIEAPISDKKKIDYVSNGKFELRDFDTTQNKFLTKIISFISIRGLLGAIVGRDIHFDSLKGRFSVQAGNIKISSMSAKGPYFDFVTYGTINTNTRKIDIGGKVVPSLYGLNKIMGSIPLIKGLFGKRGVIGVIPFSIHDSY